MKILHTVQFYEPSKGGMQEVVKQISERLVEMGHEVTVATSKDPARVSKEINGVKIVDFEISGNMVDGISGDRWEYQRFLLDSKFDIMVNFAAQQWATDVALDVLPKISAKKIFVPTGFSTLNFSEYQDYFELFVKPKMHQYDMNIFSSGIYQDYKFAIDNHIKNICVISNGADENEFMYPIETNIREKLKIPEDNFLVLHVGSHTGMKGHKEAIEIFKRANIPNSTLVITGSVFSKRCYYECKLRELFDRNIMILNLPREDIVALYKESDVFLFPSNIECSPIVLFECMAAGLPFLSTDVGNAEEIIKWSGGSGWILPTTKDKMGFSHADIKKSADLLNHMYGNKSMRAWMGWAGHTKWLQRFTWEKIAKQYEKTYQGVLNDNHC
jgi:glycosyltransferase involved in cell wall biosynthesis